MTLHFGEPYIEYKPDGMVKNDDGGVEYQYAPHNEIRWYDSATEFLDQEVPELAVVKVVV